MSTDEQPQQERPTSMGFAGGAPAPESVPPAQPPTGERPVPGVAERPGPSQTFGVAPDGDDSFGTAPPSPGTTPNPAPRPAPAAGRSVALWMGALIVLLAVIGAIVGLAIR